MHEGTRIETNFVNRSSPPCLGLEKISKNKGSEVTGKAILMSFFQIQQIISLTIWSFNYCTSTIQPSTLYAKCIYKYCRIV